MKREPLFFDVDDFLRDYNNRFEEENLVYDFKKFLFYVKDHKIKVTPKYRWIPIKHVRAINALLKNPIQLEQKIGSRIISAQYEIDIPRIFFIDLLSEASECVFVNNKRNVLPGPEYDNFLDLGGAKKKLWLILAWWFSVNWDIWMSEGDFGKMLQGKTFKLIPYIKKISNVDKMIKFKDFTKELISDLDLKWKAPSQTHVNMLMEWGIERCILTPFAWFSLIDIIHEKEDEFGIRKIKGFYIRPTAKPFFEDLVTMAKKLSKAN